MKKGSVLIIFIIILSLIFLLSALMSKMVYNYAASTNLLLQREQAFALAEAGLEKAKVEISHNPNWYTDNPYYLSGNLQWLVNYAIGQKSLLGEGYYKIVREKNKNSLYSIGQKGKGLVIIKETFSCPPYQKLDWQEL